MISEKIYLTDDKNVYLETLCVEQFKTQYSVCRTKKAMIVFPGGGYGMLAPHEGMTTARYYFGHGFNVFILHYSVSRTVEKMQNKNGVPKPLLEASLAIAHVRKNADKYGIDPDKICVLGFSAGGHLASTVATMWHKDFVYRETGLSYGENKPNAAVLCYPVVTSDPERGAHLGSFDNLFKGTGAGSAEYAEYSAEKQVDENTCPCYIWHTSQDTGVPITNSHDIARAMTKYGVPHQLHIFPYCGHGIGPGYAIFPSDGKCGRDQVYNRMWLEESVDFINYVLDGGENND